MDETNTATVEQDEQPSLVTEVDMAVVDGLLTEDEADRILDGGMVWQR